MRDSITLFSFFHNKYNMIKIYRYFLPKNFPFYKFVLTGRENSCWKKLAILWHTKILDPLTNPKVNIKFSDRKKWWKKWNDAFWQIHISRNSISNYCNFFSTPKCVFYLSFFFETKYFVSDVFYFFECIGATQYFLSLKYTTLTFVIRSFIYISFPVYCIWTLASLLWLKCSCTSFFHWQ